MKQSIINKIAQDRMVETIISNVTKNNGLEDYKDLANDIYLELLEKDEEVIDNLYEKGNLNFYITRMVLNNVDSKTSRFYYKYIKNKLKQISMDDYKETAD